MQIEWRNDRQKADVCRALCGFVGLAHLWDNDEQDERLPNFIREHVGPIPNEVGVMLAVTIAIWAGDEVDLMDILTLEAGNVRAIGELVAAMATGPEAVDEWLYKRTQRIPLDGDE